MFKTVVSSALLCKNNVQVQNCVKRHLLMRKVIRTCKRAILPMPNKPPYMHCCQVGDPVLRHPAEPVDFETVSFDYLKQVNLYFILMIIKKRLKKNLINEIYLQVMERLIYTMRAFKCIGLAAPQIGVSLQIFAVEITKKNFEENNPSDFYKKLGIEEIPLKIVVNPKLKIIDGEKIEFYESCSSVQGFQALVPRAKEVEVTGMDGFGNPLTWRAKDYTARVIQHEYDHLRVR